MTAAPDYFQPLVAWRVWRVVEARSGFHLQSPVYGTAWPAREPMEARCFRHRFSVLPWRKRQPHAPPDDGCTCGIYAAPLRTLRPYLECGPELRRVYRVVGRVSLWGTVCECERGWRASAAYPAHLYLLEHGGRRNHGASVEEIAFGLANYGVPVEILELERHDEVLDALAGEPELGACA